MCWRTTPMFAPPRRPLGRRSSRRRRQHRPRRHRRARVRRLPRGHGRPQVSRRPAPPPNSARSSNRAATQFAAAGKPAVVLDAPLLLEAGWGPMCDVILFVDTPRERPPLPGQNPRLDRGRIRPPRGRPMASRQETPLTPTSSSQITVSRRTPHRRRTTSGAQAYPPSSGMSAPARQQCLCSFTFCTALHIPKLSPFQIAPPHDIMGGRGTSWQAVRASPPRSIFFKSHPTRRHPARPRSLLFQERTIHG